jgi:[ribosomal protein S18]-alanine N-acetyltransferase
MSAARLGELPDPAELVVRVSRMKRRHVRAVLRIEHQVYPRPWSAGVFHGELAARDGRRYVVAKVGSTLVGYAGLMMMAGDAHVTNIAVDPQWHRAKIGTRLLLTLMRAARAEGASRATLEVRASNKAAQRMYQQFAFAPVGVRSRYYENTEDAIVMWAESIDSYAYIERLASIERDIPGVTLWEMWL